MMNEEAGPFFAEFQAPFGDRVYNFRMDLVGIRELQEKTDAGPAFLVTRIVGLQYKVDDLRETIRIALWRGGTDPVRAQVLMERYFDSGPVDRHRELATRILFGVLYEPEEIKMPGEDLAEESSLKDQSSPSPSSSETAPPWDSTPAPSDE
jgi:hypothetical protein